MIERYYLLFIIQQQRQTTKKNYRKIDEFKVWQFRRARTLFKASRTNHLQQEESDLLSKALKTVEWFQTSTPIDLLTTYLSSQTSSVLVWPSVGQLSSSGIKGTVICVRVKNAIFSLKKKIQYWVCCTTINEMTHLKLTMSGLPLPALVFLNL